MSTNLNPEIQGVAEAFSVAIDPWHHTDVVLEQAAVIFVNEASKQFNLFVGLLNSPYSTSDQLDSCELRQDMFDRMAEYLRAIIASHR